MLQPSLLAPSSWPSVVDLPVPPIFHVSAPLAASAIAISDSCASLLLSRRPLFRLVSFSLLPPMRSSSARSICSGSILPVLLRAWCTGSSCLSARAGQSVITSRQLRLLISHFTHPFPPVFPLLMVSLLLRGNLLFEPPLRPPALLPCPPHLGSLSPSLLSRSK